MTREPARPVSFSSEHVGWLMNRLNSVRAERLKEVLAPFGLSARSNAVLLAVDELPHPVSQQEIAAALALDQASVAIVADQLQNKGFITRDRDPRNRRRYVVELTDEGRTALAQTRELTPAIEQEMRAGLTPEEVETLRDLLLRVAAENGIVMSDPYRRIRQSAASPESPLEG